MRHDGCHARGIDVSRWMCGYDNTRGVFTSYVAVLSSHATCQALQSILILILIPWPGFGPAGRTHISSFSPGKCERSDGQML